MKWFLKNNHKDWVAIRATPDYCCVAKVKTRVDKKPLLTFAEMIEGGLDSQAFKNTVVKQKLANYPCTFVLNVNDYQCLQVDKPEVPKEELKQATHWKVKDLLDYPIEEATTDVLEIPKDPHNQNKQTFAYVVAARNQRISVLYEDLIKANVNLKAIEIKVTAQRNLARRLEQENRGLAMLTFSKLGGLLTFTAGGELYHTRFIEVIEGRFETSMERIALELQRSLDHFDRQFPYLSVNQLLVAPFDYQQAFIDYLKTALYLPVDGFALTDVFDIAEDITIPDLATQASMLHALGGALREEVAA